jgi:hypothetical protein
VIEDERHLVHILTNDNLRLSRKSSKWEEVAIRIKSSESKFM